MKVYLILDKDSTYVSCVSTEPPSDDAIFLVEEGAYPATAYHQRHDLNMCSIMMREEIKNRNELIDYLNYLGSCRNKILSIWGYDSDEELGNELCKLFNDCYDRKAAIYGEDMEDAFMIDDEDVDNGVIHAISDFEAHQERLPF
jgi:hypothetical protein